MFQLTLLKILSTGAVVGCPANYTGTTCDTGLPVVGATSGELQIVLQLVFGIVAAITVLLVIIGGIRFVVSEGNPDNVSRARETVIYAIVGLVIALSAEAIVSFALFRTS